MYNLICSFVYIVVTRLDPGSNTSNLSNTRNGDLKTFDEAAKQNGKFVLYVAKCINGYPNITKNIIIGNNQSTMDPRQNKEYRNGPLTDNSEYAIFIRVFYNKVMI